MSKSPWFHVDLKHPSLPKAICWETLLIPFVVNTSLSIWIKRKRYVDAITATESAPTITRASSPNVYIIGNRFGSHLSYIHAFL
jgi:hypothetical protein